MTSAKMERLIAIGADRADLDRIARPDTALAIWWRSMSGHLRTALAGLDLRTVHDLSIEIDATESIEEALGSARYPQDVRLVLAADIDLLVRRHAALTGNDRLQVRLKVSETEPSSRFVADLFSLRLLCTYVGPGTQWCCADGADAVCEVSTGAAAVFKGRALLDPPTVLHRPPQIGDCRLVLTVDPLQSP